jgi:hypothetical protein
MNPHVPLHLNLNPTSSFFLSIFPSFVFCRIGKKVLSDVYIYIYIYDAIKPHSLFTLFILIFSPSLSLSFSTYIISYVLYRGVIISRNNHLRSFFKKKKKRSSPSPSLSILHIVFTNNEIDVIDAFILLVIFLTNEMYEYNRRKEERRERERKKEREKERKKERGNEYRLKGS